MPPLQRMRRSQVLAESELLPRFVLSETRSRKDGLNLRLTGGRELRTSPMRIRAAQSRTSTRDILFSTLLSTLNCLKSWSSVQDLCRAKAKVTPICNENRLVVSDFPDRTLSRCSGGCNITPIANTRRQPVPPADSGREAGHAGPTSVRRKSPKLRYSPRCSQSIRATEPPHEPQSTPR
jgi:hypothetical protein